MRKTNNEIRILTLGLLLFSVLLVNAGCEKLNYPVGKDAVKWFGDGRFQILKRGTRERKILFLIDAKDDAENPVIVDRIIDYKKRGGKVYFTGINQIPSIVQYTVLNVAEGSYNIYNGKEYIPDQEEKNNFKGMEDSFSYDIVYMTRCAKRFQVAMPAGEKSFRLYDNHKQRVMLDKVTDYRGGDEKAFAIGYDKQGKFAYVVLDAEKKHYKAYYKWSSIPEFYQKYFKKYELYKENP